LFYIADSQQKWKISKGHVQTIRCLPQRFVVGGSWYDRSHYYSTPKTINSQTKIFKMNERKPKRKQKRRN